MKNLPLLVLHGWGSSEKSWQKVKKLLEKKDIEVILIDMPGFGNAPPPKKVFSTRDYALFLNKFLEKKGIKKINLLGHSFGGCVAVFFAFLFPQKVEKLILVGTPSLREKPFFKKMILFFSKKTKKFLPSFLKKILSEIFSSKDYKKSKGVMREIFKKVTKENLKEIAPKIKVKTLILHGKKDKIVPLKEALFLKKEIKNSQIEILNCAHSPHLEIPEIFVKKIERFLKI